MNTKIDLTKIASIAGAVLSIAGSVASAWASNKNMNAKIVEEVQKAVNDK